MCHEIVEPKMSMQQTDVARVVPIRDVHVVLWQHGLHGTAQQRRKMPRHRRNQQHAGLGHRNVLLEMQQAAKRSGIRGFFAHFDELLADHDRVDAVRGTLMCQPHAGDEFVGRGQTPQMNISWVRSGSQAPRHHTRHCPDGRR